MNKTTYYTLHYTNENGDDINKDIFLTKEEVKETLENLLNNYESYGTERVRGLLVTEGDKEDKLALYWSEDGSDWIEDFDNLTFEADDNFGDTDLLDIELKEDWTDTIDTIYTIEDIIENLSGNVSESELDSTIKIFKRIARRLDLKDYNFMYCYVDDGSYDPNWIFQDGQYLPYTGDGKLIYFPSANIVAEYLNGNIYIYAPTENEIKNYLKLCKEYLNPVEIDEGVEFSEDKIDASEDAKIKLKRIDDDFCW